MRIAALVIGLFAGIITFFQSCALAGVSSLGQEFTGEERPFEQMSSEAGAGILVAFMAILGAAFAIGKPKVSVVFFAIGAAIGISVGLSAETFGDLVVWGLIMLVPGALAFFGQRELQRNSYKSLRNNHIADTEPRKPPAQTRQFCIQCGNKLVPEARYCADCGAEQV